jgi:hypothetical protein
MTPEMLVAAGSSRRNASASFQQGMTSETVGNLTT